MNTNATVNNEVKTKLLIENMFATLPIGYYLGRDIKTVLDWSEASYYDPIKDEIHIGGNLIIRVIDKANLTNDTEIEEVIRGLLYHELSHTMLTSDNQFEAMENAGLSQMVWNTFEDFRIETINQNRFMRTNFNKLVKQVNGTPDVNPQDAFTLFYNLVRFDIGTDALLAEKWEIFKNNYKLNRGASATLVERYINDIQELWNKVNDEFDNSESDSDDDNEEDNSSNNGNEEDNSSNNGNEEDNSSNSSNDCNEEDNTSSNSSNNGNENNEVNEEDSTNPNSESNSNEEDNTDVDNASENPQNNNSSNEENNGNETDTEMETNNASDNEDAVGGRASNSNCPIDNEELDELWKDTIATQTCNWIDNTLKSKLAQIFKTAAKKKGYYGSAKNTYNGRINPKSVAKRDDYKWFTRKASNGDIKKYSKVHLNLFIDKSGSFKDNERRTNEFIRTLDSVTNSELSLDIITICHYIDEWNTNDRYFEAKGGNSLIFDEIAPVFKKHQLPNCTNFNIVLFDGDAHCNDFVGAGDKEDGFRVFDTNNTVIVSDNANAKYIKKCVNSAKVVYTGDYVNKFIDETVKVLDRAI